MSTPCKSQMFYGRALKSCYLLNPKLLRFWVRILDGEDEALGMSSAVKSGIAVDYSSEI